MAVGRDQIRDYALGLEMEGLGGWTYPYQRVLIDDQQGEILGLWKQVADATRADGSHYEIAGLGGQLVPLRRELPVELAAGLLRRGQRHRHLHRDDQRRGPDSGHAEAHREDRLGRAPARPLPTGRGSGRPVGGRVTEQPRSAACRLGEDAPQITAPARWLRRPGGPGSPGDLVGEGRESVWDYPRPPRLEPTASGSGWSSPGAPSSTPPAPFGSSRPAIPPTTTFRRPTSSTAVSIGPWTRPTASGRAWPTTTT